MNSTHPALGVAILAALVVFFACRYFRSARRRPFPSLGWLGLAIILISEALLALRIYWVTIYFTPLAWTGYLLLVDSLVASLQGTSLLQRSPRQFFVLAAWSVPLWLIFEAYNLRLRNWTYIGLPANPLLRDFGYIWSFATIWPAIFETADFVRALGLFSASDGTPHREVRRHIPWILALCGLLCVAMPVLLPPRLGSYLFGPVWAGFALLLDPINYHGKGASLLREWEKGQTGTLLCFLLAGLVCGFFWEFWNYWANARWIYIFPILQKWKIFEMPAPGFLGFPPFAVECFVMYEFLRTLKALFSRAAPHGQLIAASREEA